MFNDIDPEKFYDNEPTEFIESVEILSKILEDCESFGNNTHNFNRLVHTRELQNKFSSIFLNIDGNKTNFDSFAATLNTINHKFSVVALAETNIESSNKDLYSLGDDYSSVYQSKIEGKSKGSGLALYIKNCYNFTINKSLSLCSQDIESLFINIMGLDKPTVVGVVYRPPSGNVDQFNNQILNVMTQLNDCDSYILGDFNINLHNIQSLSHQKFEENFITSDFTPLISTATHQQPNCAKTCIDNIFCNCVENIKLSGTIDLDISNHYAVFQFSELSVPRPDTDKTKKITIYYEYSKDNLDKFCSILNHDLLNSGTAHNDFEAFTSVFKASVDAGCKLAIPKTTKRNSINNPWITQGIRNSIKHKQFLKKEWDKTKSNKLKDGDPVKREAYKTHCRYQRSVINLAKKKYYYRAFDESKGNSKKTWEIINKLRGKVKQEIKASFFIDNELINCRRAIANKFNSYFTSLARNLNSDAYGEIPLESFPSFQSYLSVPREKSIFLEDCTSTEISSIIGEFSNGTASDIPIVLVKKAAYIIAPYLESLINYYISAGNFPDILKVGKITPVYKKGNRENIENYRPISTLPIFGKIFEKIIYSRLYRFLSSEGVLDDSQFGFRPGHSTVHAIKHSVNIINDSHKANKHVVGIFIDLSKAFDTLDHKILMDKLYNCGIRGIAHNLISSYLTDRKQCTKFLDECSSFQYIEFGVPQGSVLGPLLFLLYINDITNSIKDHNCSLVLYADDTNVFVIGTSRDAAIARANIILKRINDFMKSNLLHINIDKCCFVHFEPLKSYNARTRGSCARTRSYVRKLDSPKIKLNGKIIEEMMSTKFLGVIIDNKLSWVPHINMLHKKLRSATGILNRISKSIPKENFKSLYYSLFESHLSYCLTIYGSANNNQTEKIFRVQKHCLRVLFGNREEYLEKFETCARVREFGKQILGSEFFCKENSKPIFQKLKILAFKNIYNYQACLEVLKLLKFHHPTLLYNKYSLSQRNNSTLLILPHRSKQFTYISSRIWNAGMKHIANDVCMTDIKLGPFKRKLKTCLLEIQGRHDKIEWYPLNFKLDSLYTQ